MWVKCLALAWNSTSQLRAVAAHFSAGICVHMKEEQIKAPLNFLTELECRWTVDMEDEIFFAEFVPMADVSIVQCYSRELSTG